MSAFTQTAEGEPMGGADLLRFLGGVPSDGFETEKFLKYTYPRREDGLPTILELRVHCGDGYWRRGRYDDFAIMARHARGLQENYGAKAIYWGINPLLPDAEHVGSKQINKFTPLKRFSRGAGDADVLHRELYLIDIDPIRPKGAMATHEEHEQAWTVAFRVRQYLSSLGWPQSIVIDSGSGYHLLYCGDHCRPTSPHWEHTLTVLAKLFDTPGAKIDQSVHNAAQISRLPGFWNRKGEETKDRKYRQAFVLEYPDEWIALSETQVIHFATINGFEERPEYDFSPELLLDDDGVHQLIREFPDQLRLRRTDKHADKTLYILDFCPFAGYRHSKDGGSEIAIILSPDRIGFKCHSDDCEKKRFGDLRRKLHEKTGRWPTVNIWSPALTDRELSCTWVDYLWHTVPAAEEAAATEPEALTTTPLEAAPAIPESAETPSEAPTTSAAQKPPFWPQRWILCTTKRPATSSRPWTSTGTPPIRVNGA